jgi:hypothetical protein
MHVIDGTIKQIKKRPANLGNKGGLYCSNDVAKD